MSIDDALKFVDALTKLLSVLVWPGILAFILVRFGPVLKDFFSNLSELSISPVGGIVAKRQAKAAAALAAAEVSQPHAADEAKRSGSAYAEAAANVVAQAATPSVIRRAGKATILWVDDRPRNNVLERSSLEALGIAFVLSTSTEDALSRVQSNEFDVILSDMGRPPDPQAGYTLLDKLRASGNKTPFIIYAGSRAPEHVEEAKRRGAWGCTNRPSELFELVLSALNRQRSAG